MRGALRSVVALFMAAFLSLGVAPRTSIEIQHWPIFPQLGQTVTVMVRTSEPLPDRICVEYLLREVGDRTPHERGDTLGTVWVPFYRLSCRTPEGKLETFRWDKLLDGKYSIAAWSERGNVVEALTQPKEMVIR